MRRITRHLSYANVTASLALFCALGGISWAAVALPRNSVGTKQLKKNAVTGPKIRANAVTSAKVKDGSLQRGDFASGTLLQGPQGPMGPQGVQGLPGQNGAPGAKGEPGIARAYARVLIAFGAPQLIPQLSHNAVGVRRVPGDPVGHFCVQVQGVSTVEIAPGFPQLATAPVANADAGFAAAGGIGVCDDATEVEVKTFDASGVLIDSHFSLVVP
jgi:hypothetical protein